jgi:WD40 repeat protein
MREDSGKLLRGRLSKSGVVITAFILVVASARAEVLFDKDIAPIFKDNCSGCHYPPAEKLKGKLDLSTLEGVLKGGSDGVVVVANKADESTLVKKIEAKDDSIMPPKGKGDPLKPEAIALIKQWIAEGAKGGGVQVAAAAPAPQPAAPAAPAHAPSVSALAFGAQGDALMLAQGGLHSVTVFAVDKSNGGLTQKFMLDGHAEMVRSLQFSNDGSLLAAAGGMPGQSGEVKIWRVADQSLVRTIAGHSDNVLDVAFSPDGKYVATCSYDKLAIIWDVATGEKIRELKNHVDAVYSLAYSPDGKLLATGAGDRTVKVWDTDSGKLLLTLSDSLDTIYAVAFSPKGDMIAAGGADKSIRTWGAGAHGETLYQGRGSSGQLLKATFAHDAAIIGLVFSPDGSTLFSTSEDKRIKSWDAEKLTERKVFEPQSDWVMALAVDPTGKFLAAGRYDASRTIYAADSGERLIGKDTADAVVASTSAEETGRKKVTSLDVEVIVIRGTLPPSLASAAPDTTQRGSELEVTLSGKNLDKSEVFASHPSIKAEIVSAEAGAEPEFKLGKGPRGTGADIFDNARPYKVKMKVAVAPDAPLGRHEIFLRTPLGMSNSVGFTVIGKPDSPEVEPNNAASEAQAIEFPAAIAAATNAAGDIDRYKFHAKAGDELVFVVTQTGPSAAMKILSSAADVIATNDDAVNGRTSKLGKHFDAEGDYVLEVTGDVLSANVPYRLQAGPFPYVTDLWPLGIPAGPPQLVAVKGFNLGFAGTATVDPPDAAPNGTVAGLPVAGFEGSPIALPVLDVSSAPEVAETEPNDDAAAAQAIAFPSVVNAHIKAAKERAGDDDFYRFAAKKDQTIILEVQSARLGSDLDSYLDVLDAKGNPIERGVVRCIAETFVTLSPRDSKSAGVRLDNWDILRMNDYAMIGSEIVRAFKMPDYGDEDVMVASFPSGQRMTFFGTTPEHHAVYTKVYKVEVAPPGTVFPANGMPVYSLYWRNDDGFFGNGDASGDSYLEFTAPADGEYVVKLRDTMGRGGDRYGYRLKLRNKEPNFNISANPYRINVSAGNSVPLQVLAIKQEGFDEPIKVSVEGLPEGFSCAPDVILPGDIDVRLALIAGPNAKSTAFDATFKVVAESTLNGQPITRESRIGVITVIEGQPDLKVNNGETKIAIAPGQSGWISVDLARANGFNSRVPIDVLNLPYGVRVLDTGLNGILVRDGETKRKMEIYVEPWVKPMDRKIYIQALIEAQSPVKPIFVGDAISLEIPAAATTAKLE